MSVCTDKCWTPIKCPDCGCSMPPAGRSAPFGSQCACSENYQHTAINTRHLWNEHDSDRIYRDPEGWAEHLKNCVLCAEG